MTELEQQLLSALESLSEQYRTEAEQQSTAVEHLRSTCDVLVQQLEYSSAQQGSLERQVQDLSKQVQGLEKLLKRR